MIDQDDIYGMVYPLSLCRSQGFTTTGSLLNSYGEESRSWSSLEVSSTLGDEDTTRCFTYEDECGPHLRLYLFSTLKKQLQNLAESTLGPKSGCRLVLDEPLPFIVDHILRLSEDEPYGLRGALILVKLEDIRGKVWSMGSFALNMETVTTFRLILNLKEVSKISSSLRNIFSSLTGSKCIRLIGKNFTITKKELYRS